MRVLACKGFSSSHRQSHQIKNRIGVFERGKNLLQNGILKLCIGIANRQELR